MDLNAIKRRLDEERRFLVREGEEIEVLPHLTRLRIDSMHIISYSSLTTENADDVIAAEVDHHRRLGVAFEWKLYAHDSPLDLKERLERHGFAIGPQEAVLVYDLSAAPAWVSHVPACTVARVDDQRQLAEFRRVAEEIFEKDYELTTTQLAAALASGSTGHRGYIATVGAEPVSIGRLYTDPKSHFAGLYGGGTRPSFRGRGCYRALVAARARDAFDLGARFLQVDALPTSRPILERLGFELLTDTWPCTLEARSGVTQ